MTARDVTIRYSARAKRPRIRVGPWREVEVVMPPGTGQTAVDRLLEENRGWLERKLAWAGDVERATRDLGLDRAGIVWIDGRPNPLPVIAGKVSPTTEALLRWYRRRARETLTARTAQCSEQLTRMGLLKGRPGRITIRDPRTRWASCSARGDLSYSWRLVMVPEAVRDYVVVHELCHLEVHNHSPAFWALLSQARPGWQDQAGWLKAHGLAIGRHRPRPGPADQLPAPLPGAREASAGTPAAA